MHGSILITATILPLLFYLSHVIAVPIPEPRPEPLTNNEAGAVAVILAAIGANAYHKKYQKDKKAASEAQARILEDNKNLKMKLDQMKADARAHQAATEDLNVRLSEVEEKSGQMTRENEELSKKVAARPLFDPETFPPDSLQPVATAMANRRLIPVHPGEQAAHITPAAAPIPVAGGGRAPISDPPGVPVVDERLPGVPVVDERLPGVPVSHKPETHSTSQPPSTKPGVAVGSSTKTFRPGLISRIRTSTKKKSSPKAKLLDAVNGLREDVGKLAQAAGKGGLETLSTAGKSRI